MINRVILMVIDSVGIGEMPDAEAFGDKGCNTLKSISTTEGGIRIPNLEAMGMGHIDGIDYLDKVSVPTGAVARLGEASRGKDTTTGHWEIAGLRIDTPFMTYPDGFPPRVMDLFEERIGRKTLCNKPASGTVILDELGEEHMKTGMPIIYTSADSVFQIAAHEDIIPLDELYSMCRIAREILMGEDQVARIIARPFVGKPGAFERTPNRRDYSLKPFEPTVLNALQDAKLDVIAVGKIVDIFDGYGITEDIHTVSNMDGVNQTINYMKKQNKGLIFTNLVDFDAKFGHRRNVEGYKTALEEFDARLPEVMAAMNDDDILMITADHGNDPGYAGTDHTREYVPLVIYGKSVKAGGNFGTLKTFSDIGATIADIFKVPATENGTSFLSRL
ncbi:MAG: phosphopentomutase [Clostridia bacterium]|nr:phosphopentomutase [Clostridia bacterium]